VPAQILNRERCQLPKLLLATALLCASATAQQIQPKAPPAKPSPPPVPVFDVQLSPDPNLSISLPDNMLMHSEGCDADGNPYVKTFGSAGMQVFGFTGKGLVTFETSKMTDIPEPSLRNLFVSSSGIYVLVTGLENVRNEEVTVKNADGQESKRVEKKGESRDYIARFDLDGSYKGALKLDSDFHPMQLATFDSGTFVVAGMDQNKTPRVGLLNSSGQLLKFLQLPKDITDRPKSAQKSFAASGQSASVDVIAMLSQLYFPMETCC
jgi:hypothetical protein